MRFSLDPDLGQRLRTAVTLLLPFLLAGCSSGRQELSIAPFQTKHDLAMASRQSFATEKLELDELLEARQQLPPASSDTAVLAQLDVVVGHAADFQANARAYRQLYADADIDGRAGSRHASDDSALQPAFDNWLSELEQQEELIHQLSSQLQDLSTELLTLEDVQSKLALLGAGQALQLDSNELSALTLAGLGDDSALQALIAGNSTGAEFDQNLLDFNQSLNAAIDAQEAENVAFSEQLQQGTSDWAEGLEATNSILNSMHNLTQQIIQNIH